MLLSVSERAVCRKRNDSCCPGMAHSNGKIHRAVRGPKFFSPVRPETPIPEEVLCRNLANSRRTIFPDTLDRSQDSQQTSNPMANTQMTSQGINHLALIIHARRFCMMVFINIICLFASLNKFWQRDTNERAISYNNVKVYFPKKSK